MRVILLICAALAAGWGLGWVLFEPPHGTQGESHRTFSFGHVPPIPGIKPAIPPPKQVETRQMPH